MADGIISIIKAKKKNVANQIFNLSSEDSNFQIRDIAKIVKKVFPAAKLNINDSSVDPRNYKVSSKKIKIKTGFVAKKTIQSALADMKKMFTQKRIKNPDNKIYNNFLSLK